MAGRNYTLESLLITPGVILVAFLVWALVTAHWAILGTGWGVFMGYALLFKRLIQYEAPPMVVTDYRPKWEVEMEREVQLPLDIDGEKCAQQLCGMLVSGRAAESTLDGSSCLGKAIRPILCSHRENLRHMNTGRSNERTLARRRTSL